MDLHTGGFFQYGFPQRQQFGGVSAHHVNLFKSFCQKAAAHRPDGPGGPENHGFAFNGLPFFHLDQAHAAHGIRRRPKRPRSAVTVPRGDGNIGLFGHGDTRVPHHLGKGPQPHDLSAHPFGHLGRLQETIVGKFRLVGQHLLGGSPH